MFTPADQPAFTLSLPGVDTDLQVLAFTGHEAINQPYCFELELVSEQRTLDLAQLLNQPAFLAFTREGGGIHGLIDSAAQGDAGRRLTHYHLTLRPQLARLAHRCNQRIFQGLSVPQIIGQVLEEHGILADAWQFHLGVNYPAREYCVQYQESDLHFIQRLCEEEGLSYHFEHHTGGHRLVFGDDQTVFPKLAPARYWQDSGMVAEEPVVSRLAVRMHTRTSRSATRDYDFRKPRLLLEHQQRLSGLPELEAYEYPGRFTTEARGRQLATRALQRRRADHCLAEGHSDLARLVSGHFLPLTEHPRNDWNDLWLLTGVHHEGKQPQVLEEALPGGTGAEPGGFLQGYRNRFTATPWEVFYRPPLHHPKPRMLGNQNAIVTGPKGEEIHCDEHARVKVQFFWDRHGQRNDHSSCWLRVASAWAGHRYGAVTIPRVGMEVLVSFLEGDPDQPLVTGCLYHGEHPAPYPLPANKTRSTFKSLSSPGGEGFNELRIEDKRGQEQVFIHAQRDWDQRIGHNQRIHVGNERHDSVGANSYSAFSAEEHRTTVGDRKVEVRGDDHLTLGNNQHVSIGHSHLMEAAREVHIKAGDKVVIEAGQELTIKAGGSWLKLDSSGVWVVGRTIQLNGSAAPGTGRSVAIQAPRLPGEVAREQPGEALKGVTPQALSVPPQQRGPAARLFSQ